MATLSSDRLTRLLISALPGAKAEPSPTAPKPIILQLPKIGRVRIYLWTTTPDQSAQGRPEGEHKSQIIIPGTPRGSVQHLDLGDIPTFVMGYSPFYGVFVVWQAERHQDSAYSKNLQVKSDLLEQASETGWALDEPRRTKLGEEVRAAIHPSHLARFITLSIDADGLQLTGTDRKAFLLAGAPELDELDLTAKLAAGQPVSLEDVERARIQATGTRLKREVGFSKRVLNNFGHRCAVCEVQLSILEGAHIIPVHDPKGSDEAWNGLALCRNHHKLYDRRIILIDKTAIVRANDETLKLLEDLGRLGGYQSAIGDFRNKKLKCLPTPYGKDADFTNRMNGALNYTYSQTPDA